MIPSSSFRNLLLAWVVATASALSTADMLERPIITRFWQTGTYTLGDRVSTSQAAEALAGIKPSYVSGLYRFAYQDKVTSELKQAYSTIRHAVRHKSPNAKFDMVLNLDPSPKGNKKTYPDAEAVVDMMKYLNSELKFESWFFDFLSVAERKNSTWVHKVVEYAHSMNQTVGGNVFGSKIPPNVDFASFDDGQVSDNPAFGYGIDEKQLAKLKAKNTQHVAIVGHMNNNPQNDPSTTLSCVFIEQWNATRRADYQDYWVSQQKSKGGFTYMFPVFFPQCPAVHAYDPLNDTIPNTNGKTVYDHIKTLALTDDK